MLRMLGTALLVASMSTAAFARHHDDNPGKGWGDPVSAPEIDPSSIITALTMLGGGLVLVRAGRSNKR